MGTGLLNINTSLCQLGSFGQLLIIKYNLFLKEDLRFSDTLTCILLKIVGIPFILKWIWYFLATFNINI